MCVSWLHIAHDFMLKQISANILNKLTDKSGPASVPQSTKSCASEFGYMSNMTYICIVYEPKWISRLFGCMEK
jgi:hypothetical protein